MSADRSGDADRGTTGLSANGIIGVGAIAAAIVTGLCEGLADAPDILLSPRSASVAARLASHYASVRVAAGNREVVDGAATIVLAVRPQDAEAVLRPLRFRDDQIVISLMAGLSVAAVADLVAPATEVVRAVPLPAVARRRGITPVHPPQPIALALFDRLGGAVAVEDVARFDAFCAVTATMAAQIDMLATIANWLEGQGLDRDEAARYVAALSSGIDLSEAGRTMSFAALAEDHATRGGINEQFLEGLRDAGMPARIREGLDAILKRISKT